MQVHVDPGWTVDVAALQKPHDMGSNFVILFVPEGSRVFLDSPWKT
jgi:hypothetical protein